MVFRCSQSFVLTGFRWFFRRLYGIKGITVTLNIPLLPSTKKSVEDQTLSIEGNPHLFCVLQSRKIKITYWPLWLHYTTYYKVVYCTCFYRIWRNYTLEQFIEHSVIFPSKVLGTVWNMWHQISVASSISVIIMSVM